MVQPPRDHAFVTTTKPKAAAAARIGAGLADRKRAELLGLLRSYFVRPEPCLQSSLGSKSRQAPGPIFHQPSLIPRDHLGDHTFRATTPERLTCWITARNSAGVIHGGR
jgi:hypothetical protein